VEFCASFETLLRLSGAVKNVYARKCLKVENVFFRVLELDKVRYNCKFVEEEKTVFLFDKIV
jgi:hypothetical protein